MRYHLAALILVVVLPACHALAAPIPDPWVILDIGPPPKGETLEQHRNREINDLTRSNGFVVAAWRDSEVRKSPSIVALKDPLSWLSKNISVTPEGKGSRLRLTFRAGTRAEQVAILNAVLRDYQQEQTEYRKRIEEKLQLIKKGMPRLETLIATETVPERLERYRKEFEAASSRIVELPAEIARCKQIAVVKWAK